MLFEINNKRLGGRPARLGVHVRCRSLAPARIRSRTVSADRLFVAQAILRGCHWERWQFERSYASNVLRHARHKSAADCEDGREGKPSLAEQWTNLPFGGGDGSAKHQHSTSSDERNLECIATVAGAFSRYGKERHAGGFLLDG